MSKTQTLSIDLLRLDGDTQSRIEVHQETVEEYADVLVASNGKKAMLWPFGPVTVYHDGSSYFIADGFHRVLAAHKAGRASVPCDVKNGTARDARFFGMKANDKHGLRMSREDRRNNVVWMLEKYPEMTQLNIAENAGVTTRTVERIKAELNKCFPTMSGKTEDKPKPLQPRKFDEAEEFYDDDTPYKSVNLLSDSDEPNEDQVEDDPAPAKPPEKPPLDRNEQAKRNRQLAQQHIDAAVRAVDDLHHIKRNERNRAAAVKMLQDAGRLLW